MSTTAPLLQSLAAALADGSVQVVDLTQPLHEKTPVLQLPEPFANTPGLTRHEISRYDDRGPAWAWSWLEIGEHVGTHFDAPIHWITGKDGEDLRASRRASRRPRGDDRQVGRGRGGPRLLLSVDDVRAFEAEHGPLPAGGWLLLRTGWDARAHDQDEFLNAGGGMPRTPGVDAECAKWLAQETPIVGIGVETVGTDAGGAAAFDPPFPVHSFFLGAGKYGLTQLANLAAAAADGRRARRRAAEARRRHGQPDARARAGRGVARVG